MGKKRGRRAAEAAHGTAKDPLALRDAAAGAGEAALRESGSGKSAVARPESAYERRTARFFTVVEVILVVVPVAMVAYLWLMGGGSLDGLQDAFAADPAITVAFVAAMCQPLAAWLLRFVHSHYRAGDGGYAVANLIGLVCGELLLQNIVGVIGCAVLLWRIWKRVVPAGEFAAWRNERSLGGKLADLSGVIVLAVLGVICAFATWRIGLVA